MNGFSHLIEYCGSAPDQLCVVPHNIQFRDWNKCAIGCMETRQWLGCVYQYLAQSDYSPTELSKVMDYIGQTLYTKQAWYSLWTCEYSSSGQRQADLYKGWIADSWNTIEICAPITAVAVAALAGITTYHCYKIYCGSCKPCDEQMTSSADSIQ
jgi:hypothetical protein